MSNDYTLRRRPKPADTEADSPVRRRQIVGAVDDVAEAEADRMAEQALLGLAEQPVSDVQLGRSRISRSGSMSGDTIGAAGGEVTESTQRALDRARGAGSQLDGSTRQSMESAFGADFGRVRVHDGSAADRLSRSMQAAAFTVGGDVFFSAGAYRPQTPGGQRLLAHELSHVVQNGGAPTPGQVNRFFDRKKRKKSPDEEAKLAASPDLATDSGEGTNPDLASDSGEGNASPDQGLQAAVKELDPSAFGQTKTLAQLSKSLRETMTPDDLKHAKRHKTTLHKLTLALDELARTKRQPDQLPIVRRVGRLAERYMQRHRTSKDADEQARVRLAEDIDQLAQVHIIRTYADMKYAQDVQGEGKNPFQHLNNKAAVVQHSTAFAANTLDPKAPPIVRDGHEVSSQFGLSQGEILAIRTYTAQNYKYINPAVTNWDLGLEKYHKAQNGGDGAAAMTAQTKTEMKREGTAHAGMAVKGLSKLPAWTGGSTFRGDNVDAARMRQLYTRGKVRVNETLLSTSKTPTTAQDFVRKSNGPIKLMVEIDLTGGTGGRDISKLSAITGEEEVLVMPGAKYVTVSIEEYDAKTGMRTPLTGRPTEQLKPDGTVPTYYVVVRQEG